MGELLTQIGVMLIVFGVVVLVLSHAATRNRTAETRAIREANQRRLEAAEREHEQARAQLAANTRERRN